MVQHKRFKINFLVRVRHFGYYPSRDIFMEKSPMNELTVHFQTQNRTINPEFLSRLRSIADEFGVSINLTTRQLEEFIRKADEFARQVGTQTTDSADLIREDRDWLDRRDVERAAQLGGLRPDLSHLNNR